MTSAHLRALNDSNPGQMLSMTAALAQLADSMATEEALAAQASIFGEARLIKQPEVLARISMCRMSMTSLIKLGKFPPSVKVGKRGTFWIDALITIWLRDLASGKERDWRKPYEA